MCHFISLFFFVTKFFCLLCVNLIFLLQNEILDNFSSPQRGDKEISGIIQSQHIMSDNSLSETQHFEVRANLQSVIVLQER